MLQYSQKLYPELLKIDISVCDFCFFLAQSILHLLYLWCHRPVSGILLFPPSSPLWIKLKVIFHFSSCDNSFPKQGQHYIRRKQVRKSSIRSLNCGKALFQVLEVSPWILHPQVALSQSFSFKFYISMDKLHINHLCGSRSSWHFSYSLSFDISSSG